MVGGLIGLGTRDIKRIGKLPTVRSAKIISDGGGDYAVIETKDDELRHDLYPGLKLPGMRIKIVMEHAFRPHIEWIEPNDQEHPAYPISYGVTYNEACFGDYDSCYWDFLEAGDLFGAFTFLLMMLQTARKELSEDEEGCDCPICFRFR